MIPQTDSVSSPVLFFFFSPLPSPNASGNHIFQGQAAGIAVNENGRGVITGVRAPRTHGAEFPPFAVPLGNKTIAKISR